jgi:hypothetical protein
VADTVVAMISSWTRVSRLLPKVTARFRRIAALIATGLMLMQRMMFA